MRTIGFICLAVLLFITLPYSGFAQNDSIYIHSKGKIVFSGLLANVDSITFARAEGVPVLPERGNKVLLLQIDYTSHKFISGAEVVYDVPVDTFTIAKKYVSPGDFGSIKFYYPQIDKPLFYGTIIWTGNGKIEYPENWLDADEFDATLTEDVVIPQNGFENIFKEYEIEDFDYMKVWFSIQSVVKVREYLKSNPEQKVKVFLYAPRVGFFDPAVAKWIFLLVD